MVCIIIFCHILRFSVYVFNISLLRFNKFSGDVAWPGLGLVLAWVSVLSLHTGSPCLCCAGSFSLGLPYTCLDIDMVLKR